jgi:hypothetical protein
MTRGEGKFWHTELEECHTAINMSIKETAWQGGNGSME